MSQSRFLSFELTALAVPLGLAALGLTAQAHAANLQVNSTADTLVAGDGQCTLREATLNANDDTDLTAGDCAAGSGPDEIHVPAGHYVLSIPGADEDLGLTGDLDLRDEVAVIGAGADVTVIDAGGLDRVLDGVGQIRLQGLKVTGGAVAGGDGGGVSVSGDLTVAGSDISGSRAESDPDDPEVGGGWGGGIDVRGSIEIDRSTVSRNQAQNDGGGIYVSGTAATLDQTTVSRNHAGSEGGGIFGHANLSLLNSTVSENTAGSCQRGGGGSNGTGGAAIRVSYLSLEGLSLEHSTVAGNACLGPGDPRLFSPSALFLESSFSSRGSALDNPEAANCRFYVGVSGGHNIDSDGSCGLTDLTDLSNVDPMLGALQDNGGPTPTHALLAGSPAIDHIPTAACTWDHDGDPETAEVALAEDQRGARRPRDGSGAAPWGCDVGSYEVARCANGIDDDGDSLVDFDGGATAGIDPPGSPDPHCTSAFDDQEAAPSPPGCGIGPELALLLPGLWWLRRRRG